MDFDGIFKEESYVLGTKQLVYGEDADIFVVDPRSCSMILDNVTHCTVSQQVS